MALISTCRAASARAVTYELFEDDAVPASWGKHGMEYALLMGILALAILFRLTRGVTKELS